MKIGVLASGQLGFTILKKLSDKYELEFVLTDSLSQPIIQFCQENEIPVFKGNPRNGRTHSFLDEKTCDVLLSINYLFLIEQDLITFPKKYTVNFHGSLLPKYRGRTPHVWAIINNESVTGITAHLVDEDCDTGAIIAQVEVPINAEDTGASILAKFNNLYWPLVNDVLSKIENDSIVLTKQNELEATFFGKRTPEDGCIDWAWQKERIHNWVRAQADPYPGAFSFYEGNKVIIDKIAFSNVGYHADMPNGTILLVEPLTIKTPNGAIEIASHRNLGLTFITGKIFTNENRK